MVQVIEARVTDFGATVEGAMWRCSHGALGALGTLSGEAHQAPKVQSQSPALQLYFVNNHPAELLQPKDHRL